MVKELLLEEYDGIVIVSGDGLIHEVCWLVISFMVFLFFYLHKKLTTRLFEKVNSVPSILQALFDASIQEINLKVPIIIIKLIKENMDWYQLKIANIINKSIPPIPK